MSQLHLITFISFTFLLMQGLPGPQGATGETGKPGEQVRIAGNCENFAIYLDLFQFVKSANIQVAV